MKRTTDQQGSQYWNDGDGEQRGTDHRERLRERERMEQLALLARQREDRHEREDDDGHGEEDGAADLLGGFQHDLPGLRSC
jgi:hypothetical protein